MEGSVGNAMVGLEIMSVGILLVALEEGQGGDPIALLHKLLGIEGLFHFSL